MSLSVTVIVTWCDLVLSVVVLLSVVSGCCGCVDSVSGVVVQLLTAT